MSKISSKKWIVLTFVFILILLSISSIIVMWIDPFFHFHKPHTDEFLYSLDNERSQNNGIIKHFDYDALITGSSMTQNTKVSQVDKLFNVNSIKVPFSGGSFKEIDDNIKLSIEKNPNLKMVIRALDENYYFQDKDHMRDDIGEYPTYLYNENPFDDIKYIWNKDILLGRCFQMMLNKRNGVEPGTTDFDSYMNWMEANRDNFNPSIVLSEKESFNSSIQESLTDEEKYTITQNIEQNVIKTAKENPNIRFIYYIPPYSLAWWGDKMENSQLDKFLSAERLVFDLILSCDNIELYAFNDRTEIISNLSNYKDPIHYADWITDEIILDISKGEGRITISNKEEYLKKQELFLKNFDYNSLFNQ